MRKKLLSIFILLITLTSYANAQDGTWYSYSGGPDAENGGINGSMNPTSSSHYETAILYTSEDIKDAGFNTISEVRVGTNADGPTPTSTVLIMQDENILASKTFTVPGVKAWTTVTLDDPVSIDKEKDLYVVVRYQASQSFYPYAGHDKLTGDDGKGNLYREVGTATWEKNSISFGNWSIQFYAYHVQAPTYISYDEGEPYLESFLWNIGTNYDVAIKYTAQDIQDLGFTSIYAVKTYIYQGSTPPLSSSSVMIWQEDDLINPLHQQSFNPTYNTWTEVELTSPVNVDPSKDLYIAIRYGTGNKYMGYAVGDAELNAKNKGKSNIYRVITDGTPGEWVETSNLGDWCIQAAVDLPAQPDRFNVTFTNIKAMTAAAGLFDVTDAVITLGDKTNKPGEYAFKVLPGEYRYVITKEGVTPFAGTVTVTDEDVVVDMMLSGLMWEMIENVYTITFDIKDEESNPVTDALITFNKYNWTSYTADNVKIGVYNYSISKFGYETVEGTVLVIGNETIEVVLPKQPLYSMSFTVLDGNSLSPITDAVVSIDDMQNAAGNYSFTLPDGTYKYIAQKEGYQTLMGSVTVSGANQTQGLMMTAGEDELLYNVNIEVVDESDRFLTSAVRTVNGEVVGQSSKMKSGVYDYIIECEGYVTQTGKLVVTDGGYLRIVMIPALLYKLKFEVSDNDTSAPILDASVSVGTYINEAGNYIFNVYAGTYTYLVKKEGYKTNITTIDVVDRDLKVAPKLTPGTDEPATLTFNLFGEEGEALTDAILTFDGTAKPAGNYVVENYPLGVYDYSIVLEGYVTISGKYILTETKTETVNMVIARYDFGFTLPGYVRSATVSLDDMVNEEGNYKYQQIPYGSYQYIIRAEGYATQYGTIQIPNDLYFLGGYGLAYDIGMPEGESDKLNLTFDIKNTSGNAVNNATVTLNGEEQTKGVYSFSLEPEIYTYKVEKDEYSQEGQVILTAAKTIEVELPISTYTLSFIVKDNKDNDITDAVVIVNNYNYGAGTYEINDLLAGDYLYSINKEGYYPAEGTATIVGSDVEVNIIMVPITYAATFVVKDISDNLVTDAVVAIEGVEYGAGVYEIEEIRPGTYNYTVSREDFYATNGTFIIDDQDIEVKVILNRTGCKNVPTKLNATGINASQAILSWQENGAATAWDIKYGVIGFNIESEGTLISNITNNPYTLTNLSSDTQYDFYVRTNCGAEEQSDWSSSYTFRTDVDCNEGVSLFPWTEGFEGEVFPPQCWSLIDNDGDGYDWAQFTLDPHSGNNSASSASYYNSIGELYPDNYLITPLLNLPMATTIDLSYWVASQDNNFPQEHYEIMVSTTGTKVGDFTSIYEETLSSSTWKENTVSLADYAGKSVYVAFVHNKSTDQFIMKIDDVKIETSGVGISEVGATGIKVYPNPFADKIMIEGELASDANIFIMDANGRYVLQTSFAGERTISTDQLSSGIYFVIIRDGEGNQTTHKMIKK